MQAAMQEDPREFELLLGGRHAAAAGPHKSVNVHAVMWYGYGRGGDRDVDWGCLYRSVQNACKALGMRVPSLTHLVEDVAHRKMGQWGEPGMFISFFKRAGVDVQAVVLHNASCIRFTKRVGYEHLANLPAHFWDPAYTYVVDNGTSAYAVVPSGGKLWWIDPHVVYPATPKPVHFAYAHHMAHDPHREGWMILKLHRDKR